MIMKYVVEKWEREAEWFMHCGKYRKEEMKTVRSEDSQEPADVGGLFATWGHGEGSGEQTEEEVCLTPGTDCCQQPCLGPWSYSSYGLC